jgi:hypothetical protein
MDTPNPYFIPTAVLRGNFLAYLLPKCRAAEFSLRLAFGQM